MNSQESHGGIIILTSFIIALVLTLLPLPENLRIYRPEWVTLVLIYWCLALPHRVGVFSGWAAGLLLDVCYGTPLGQYALALAVTAYVCYKLHVRIRIYPLLQQALIILILVALSQMIVLWLKGATNNPPGSWTYWLPSITSMLIWPWIYNFLRAIRQAYGVN